MTSNVKSFFWPRSTLTFSGDVPGSASYHADLAWEYGIRFVWASELTPVIGQGREAAAAEYYAGHVERPRAARWSPR